MLRNHAAAVMLVVACLVVLSGCDEAALQPEDSTGAECQEGEQCLEPSDTPTATPEDGSDETATPTPTEEELEPTPTDTPVPTVTPTPKPPTPTPAVVTDWSVIYHDAVSFCMDGGTYNSGVMPWMDVLVRLGETWYGPDRWPGDAVDPLPLPEQYTWVCTGSFSCLPNGEAWLADPGQKSPPACTEPTYTGAAKLFGPGGGFVKEIPLRVTISNP